MSQPTVSNLGQLLSGYWVSQAIYAAAKLGLADLVRDNPQTAEQLATATQTQAGPLYRLLRALASVGVFREDEQHRFALTPLAEQLRADAPNSQKALAIMCGEEHYVSWSEILYSLRTGKPAFDKIYGKGVFDWLSTHPEQAAVFDQAMVDIHGRETEAMLDAYDFSTIGVLADVGGGNGSLLRGVLARHKNMQAMLCDLPGVIERATPLIAAAGLSDRMRTVATNFFEKVPAGGDAYLMRHIIHDWDDEKSLVILRNVRQALRPEGKLLLIESVIRPGNEPHPAKLLDLNMLVIPGGQERTEAEYRRLFDASGFRLASITPTKSAIDVVEARPV